MKKETNSIAGSGGPAVMTFTRYLNGAVSNITYPDGSTIHRDYTSRSQLKTVSDGRTAAPTIAYSYWEDGKVKQADYANGMRTAYGYDARGMIQSVDHKLGEQQIYSHRDYYRDLRDRITAFKKGTGGSNQVENGRGDRFRYDEEGQLLEAWYNAADPASSGAGNTRYDGFNYDALGNRKDWGSVASKGWMHFLRRDNGLNQYVSWENNAPPGPQHWGSGILHDDNFDQNWQYPGNGMTMGDGWIVASYNALNQPVAIGSSATWAAGAWMWFGFDPLGRCVKRVVGPNPASGTATYLYYEGWNLIQEGPSAGSAARQYIHGARVDEMVKQITPGNGLARYFHFDARGHCTLQTDGSGNIAEQYEYDAFGQPYFYDANGAPMTVNGQPGSVWGNRFLFTGREWLSDLKLYDYRNRMYQPELGRFMQPDPKQFEAGDYNLYRYCHNDPVNRSDPTGMDGLTMMGKGDWDFDNGRVALAQIELQKPAQTPKQELANAIKGFENDQQRGQGISPQQVIDAGVREGQEAERLVHGDLRTNPRTKQKYGVERGFSEFVDGKHLAVGGPAVGPDNQYDPTVPLPTRPNSGASLGPRFMGIHAHGPQSRRSFDKIDIPLGEGKFGNSPYISVVTSTLDKGRSVHFNVPGHGTWSTSDGGATFRVGD